ncbi:hypothetical protein BQ8482_180261 [Mesorhizobium delmotii]|uniref:Uncharacterized protein n=1 Tax=Mesorhizobium delmotii TaxID=1631247 RepID=A0A2P9AIV5_9HYPH|nr:hypothetical protein BQ8482_180261 [Mesorhizobium delmotii]
MQERLDASAPAWEIWTWFNHPEKSVVRAHGGAEKTPHAKLRSRAVRRAYGRCTGNGQALPASATG